MTILRRTYVGKTIKFDFRFADENNEPITPSGGELFLSYNQDGTPTGESIPLVADGTGLFSYNWDSKVADAGKVYWDARSTGVGWRAVEEGEFTLVANPANPGNG